MVIRAPVPAAMGAAARCLADQGGALQILEVVSQLLRARERAAAGQQVDRLRQVPLPGNMRPRPELASAVVRPPVEVVQMRRPGKEIAAQHGNRIRRDAPLAGAQVDDESVGVGQVVHRRAVRVTGDLGRSQQAELQKADIALQDVQLREAEIIARHAAAVFLAHRRRRGGPGLRLRRQHLRRVTDANVLIVTDRAQVLRQRCRERFAIRDRVIDAGGCLAADGFLHLLGHLREHVPFS